MCVYLDDIFISGADSNAYYATVNTISSVLSKNEVRLRREKCKVTVSQGTYPGHMIVADGLHPLSENITSIQSAHVQKKIHNLNRTWVCYNSIIGFYQTVTTLVAPLYTLLRNGVTV